MCFPGFAGSTPPEADIQRIHETRKEKVNRLLLIGALFYS